MTVPTVPDELADLPPSAVAVWLLLADRVEEPATQHDLVEEGHLAPRTVRYALKRLVEAELVESRTQLGDARLKEYHRRLSSDTSNP